MGVDIQELYLPEIRKQKKCIYPLVTNKQVHSEVLSTNIAERQEGGKRV